MITFTRQPDGTFLQEGSLPARSTVNILIIPDIGGPKPVYKLEYALGILTRGPLRHNLYQVVEVSGSGKAGDDTEDKLATAHRTRTEGRRQRRVAREQGAELIESHVEAPADDQQVSTVVESTIQPEGAKQMVKQTRTEQGERAKKIREQFADGASVAQLVARFSLANPGVVGNILTGRSNPKAGGPIVKTTRRPKEKKETA